MKRRTLFPLFVAFALLGEGYFMHSTYQYATASAPAWPCAIAGVWMLCIAVGLYVFRPGANR